jgi:hypothetical protein
VQTPVVPTRQNAQQQPNIKASALIPHSAIWAWMGVNELPSCWWRGSRWGGAVLKKALLPLRVLQHTVWFDRSIRQIKNNRCQHSLIPNIEPETNDVTIYYEAPFLHLLLLHCLILIVSLTILL